MDVEVLWETLILVLSSIYKTKFSCLEEEPATNSLKKSFKCPLGSNQPFPSLDTLNGVKLPRKLIWNNFVVFCVFDGKPELFAEIWALLCTHPFIQCRNVTCVTTSSRNWKPSGNDLAISIWQSVCWVTCAYQWKHSTVVFCSKIN